MIEKVQDQTDGALKKRFRIANPNDVCVLRLQEYCKFSSILFKIPIIPKPLCKDFNCHDNVNRYVRDYGGERIVGYYLITEVDDENYGCAIYHSIWKNTYGEIIDITPFQDCRKYNMFSILENKIHYSGVLYDGKNYKILFPGKNKL